MAAFEAEELLEKFRDLGKEPCEAAKEAEKLFSLHADTSLFHVNEALLRDSWYMCAVKSDLREISFERKVRAVHWALREKTQKSAFELFILSSTPTEGEPYDGKALKEMAERFPQATGAVWADFILAAGLRGEPAKVEEFLSRNPDSRLAPTARIILANWLSLSPETVENSIVSYKDARRLYPESHFDYYTAGSKLLGIGEKISAGEQATIPVVLGFYNPPEGGERYSLKDLKKALGLE